MKSLRCDCDERRKSLGLIRQDMSRKISDLIETFKIIIGNYQWYNCGGTRGNGAPLPFLVGERRYPSLHDRYCQSCIL